jgi:hypothetical protein
LFNEPFDVGRLHYDFRSVSTIIFATTCLAYIYTLQASTAQIPATRQVIGLSVPDSSA